jgi:RNA polymerase sigma-70 factor (ECF subfamily)
MSRHEARRAQQLDASIGDAFEATFMPYLNDAWTLAHYLLRNRQDAEDAVQDAALRAFRHFESYRGGDPRAWLLAIVRNCCMTSLRRHRHDRMTVSISDDRVSALRAPRDADADAIAQSERAVIGRALAALPIGFREVLVLREVQGMSYAQISEVTKLPIGTIMSRLSRARRRLAKSAGLMAPAAPSSRGTTRRRRA